MVGGTQKQTFLPSHLNWPPLYYKAGKSTTLLTLSLNARNSSEAGEGLVVAMGGLAFLAFLPLDALLIEEVQLPLSDEFFLSAIVGGGGAAFFFRLRPNVVVFGLSETASAEVAEASAAALMLLLLCPSLSTSILQSSICKAMQRSSIAIHSYTTTTLITVCC